MGLIESLPVQCLSSDFFLPALDGSSGFAFTYLGRLFVEFTAMDFGEHASFLASAFKASHGDIEGFIISDFNRRHE